MSPFRRAVRLRFEKSLATTLELGEIAEVGLENFGEGGGTQRVQQSAIEAFHILRVSSHPAKQVVADECSLAFQQLGRFSKTLLFISLKGSTTEVSKKVEHQSQMVVGGAAVH